VAKGILVGTLTGDGQSVDFDARGYFGSRWTVFFAGSTYSGSTVTIQVGDGTNFEDLYVFDPVNQAWALRVGQGNNSKLAPYMVECPCSHLRFLMAGGTSPNISIYLWPQRRSS
jgi:hypothetical protein